MFDVITVGGATRDVFFKTDKGKIVASNSKKLLAFEYGAKIVPEDAYFSYGGGGMNTAVSFAKLGLKVAAKVNIGSEGTGSLVHKTFKERKVNTSLIERDKKLHTALSIIISDNGDHTMFLYRGANDDLKIKNWSELKKIRWLYISSLTGNSENILKKIPEFISKNNIKLAWNPGSVQLEKGYSYMRKILKTTSILILNEAEARELLGSKNRIIKSSDSTLLKEIKKMGPDIVVITKGRKGSIATNGSQNYQEKALSAKVKETTGAGDSYGSTFVAGIILGYSILESMNLAGRNAASVVGRVGAQEGLLTLKELKAQKLTPKLARQN